MKTLTPQARMWGYAIRRLISHTSILVKDFATESKVEANLV